MSNRLSSTRYRTLTFALALAKAPGMIKTLRLGENIYGKFADPFAFEQKSPNASQIGGNHFLLFQVCLCGTQGRKTATATSLLSAFSIERFLGKKYRYTSKTIKLIKSIKNIKFLARSLRFLDVILRLRDSH